MRAPGGRSRGGQRCVVDRLRGHFVADYERVVVLDTCARGTIVAPLEASTVSEPSALLAAQGMALQGAPVSSAASARLSAQGGRYRTPCWGVVHCWAFATQCALCIAASPKVNRVKLSWGVVRASATFAVISGVSNSC